MKVDPPFVGDLEQIELGLRGMAPAGRRHTLRQFDRGRAETAAQHDIHDLLVGAIAIFQRDLLRQDVDARDRFGGQIADFGKARDTLAVEQHHRGAATAAVAADLRAELGEQFGHRADAVRTNVGGRQLLLGWNVADHRTRRPRAAHHDIATVVALVGDRRRLCRRPGGSRFLLLRQGKGRGCCERKRQQGRRAFHYDSIRRSRAR